MATLPDGTVTQKSADLGRFFALLLQIEKRLDAEQDAATEPDHK